MDSLGVYVIKVFDENDQQVDQVTDVIAWNGREAYYSVMNDLVKHSTYIKRRLRAATVEEITTYLTLVPEGLLST